MSEKETADEKSAVERAEQAFLELWRLYPLLKPSDYIEHGRWDTKKMEIDTELIEAHRKEAGAPEPQPLEELTLPEMPKLAPVRAPLRFSGLAAAAAARRAGSVPSAASSASAGAKGGPRPPSTPPPASAVTATMGIAAMATFAERWGLDRAASRSRLMKLMPERRRQVMAFFKHTPNGSPDSALAALDAYIASMPKMAVPASAPRLAAAGGGAIRRPTQPAAGTAGRGTSALRPAVTPRLSTLRPTAPRAGTLTPRAPATKPPLTAPLASRFTVTPSVKRSFVPSSLAAAAEPAAKRLRTGTTTSSLGMSSTAAARTSALAPSRPLLAARPVSRALTTPRGTAGTSTTTSRFAKPAAPPARAASAAVRPTARPAGGAAPRVAGTAAARWGSGAAAATPRTPAARPAAGLRPTATKPLTPSPAKKVGVASAVKRAASVRSHAPGDLVGKLLQP
eukprot:TRINITY_DN91225_c0_g1_i1.p2 TRINITY_DN91225_c0_g1~~TRINITY_DN91225_c0_g1_i1.p2  ORF type:complete len:453 (+),score=56.53 TRINITY_DN91225_c0_g1_i1:107-1465(+)